MAEYFKKKIIGKLSDKPIILKKINPITTTPIVKVTLPEEIVLITEEPVTPEEIVSEEIIKTPIEEVVTPEEPKTKKSRKKKSE
jgi:hypothetical protein